ncbi:MAG: adenosyl-hopene transferase HpnH [Armatimonadetes bacterium]|nr:adenosyl-hopene transferase HpnH [Armatimonadota bacterium]
MRFPIGFSLAQAKYMTAQKRSGRKRYPTVVMLEPLYTCNLACIGCSVERHTGKLKDRLPLEECLKAVDDAGVPIVAICGGEPTLYPELPQLLETLIARGKYIILCTNALLLDQKVFGVIPPSKQLFVNVHLDGLKETHDFVCDRKGVFDKALDMIRESKKRGYLTITNTTIFKETDIEEVEQLCELLTDLKVDGILISPGYHYESVQRDVFLTQEEIHNRFRQVMKLSNKYKLTATPMFLEFAAGLRELACSPYSTVNFTPRGWKGPCYLIGDRYYADFNEFWDTVDWAYWETRQDRRCANCKMHSGFEHSAVEEASRSLKSMMQLAAWHVSG